MGFGSLWEMFIRPSRQEYSISDLGNELQMHGSFRSRRTDFILPNKQNQKLQCSIFEPMLSSQQTETLKKFPCVVYCHCNSGSRIEALRILSAVVSRGMALFCFDFAGSGLSDGDYVTLGLNESLDLECVVAYLQDHPKVSNIALWGRSMGAATCLMYAGKKVSQRGVKAIVFDSGFSNIRMLALGLAKQRTGFPNMLIEPALALVSDQVKERVSQLDIHSIDLAKVIHTIYTPCFFVTSTEDTFVKSEQVEQLHARYNGQKWIQYITGEHNGQRTNQIIDQLTSWVAQMVFDQQIPLSPIITFDKLPINTTVIDLNATDMRGAGGGGSGGKLFLPGQQSMHTNTLERSVSPVKSQMARQNFPPQLLRQQQSVANDSPASSASSSSTVRGTSIPIRQSIQQSPQSMAFARLSAATITSSINTSQAGVPLASISIADSHASSNNNHSAIRRSCVKIYSGEKSSLTDTISPSQSRVPTEETASRYDQVEGAEGCSSLNSQSTVQNNSSSSSSNKYANGGSSIIGGGGGCGGTALTTSSQRYSFLSNPNYEESNSNNSNERVSSLNEKSNSILQGSNNALVDSPNSTSFQLRNNCRKDGSQSFIGEDKIGLDLVDQQRARKSSSSNGNSAHHLKIQLSPQLRKDDSSSSEAGTPQFKKPTHMPSTATIQLQTTKSSLFNPKHIAQQQSPSMPSSPQNNNQSTKRHHNFSSTRGGHAQSHGISGFGSFNGNENLLSQPSSESRSCILDELPRSNTALAASVEPLSHKRHQSNFNEGAGGSSQDIVIEGTNSGKKHLTITAAADHQNKNNKIINFLNQPTHFFSTYSHQGAQQQDSRPQSSIQSSHSQMNKITHPVSSINIESIIHQQQTRAVAVSHQKKPSIDFSNISYPQSQFEEKHHQKYLQQQQQHQHHHHQQQQHQHQQQQQQLQHTPSSLLFQLPLTKQYNNMPQSAESASAVPPQNLRQSQEVTKMAASSSSAVVPIIGISISKQSAPPPASASVANKHAPQQYFDPRSQRRTHTENSSLGHQYPNQQVAQQQLENTPKNSSSLTCLQQPNTLYRQQQHHHPATATAVAPSSDNNFEKYFRTFEEQGKQLPPPPQHQNSYNTNSPSSQLIRSPNTPQNVSSYTRKTSVTNTNIHSESISFSSSSSSNIRLPFKQPSYISSSSSSSLTQTPKNAIYKGAAHQDPKTRTPSSFSQAVNK